MADDVFFRASGQAGYEVDCGHHTKTRVVFGIFDEEKTSIAWYLFASAADKKSQKECETTDVLVTEQFGFRTDVGRHIRVLFRKKIGLDGLADKKGSFATLNMDATDKSRLIGCRIAKLKTKAGEVVTFPFGFQQNSKPARANQDIEGKVLFLESGPFDEKTFHLGPQGKDSKIKISGGVV
ncbi:hypothetical protein Msil_2375 [Methylocella silvestris BL2]|uniref:Uncharacterized protein n=1 Tax=Methylocella silvestris (strain DSM 15510 / CIP 108128 / LMG 27833 / NCIMB 13906 / BL2) TaxID=395965 RepID=B8EII6_METSB|nr:hypothetical protein [Methylocella silvestris]ACK51305.1 hypothetical protein Msil_2375 [Methylocella silvestris BL2]